MLLKQIGLSILILMTISTGVMAISMLKTRNEYNEMLEAERYYKYRIEILENRNVALMDVLKQERRRKAHIVEGLNDCIGLNKR